VLKSDDNFERGRSSAVNALLARLAIDRKSKGVGERYRDGEGVEKDLIKAKMYLSKAVDAGSSDAKNELERLEAVQ
jgi:TPR repeat protein